MLNMVYLVERGVPSAACCLLPLLPIVDVVETMMVMMMVAVAVAPTLLWYAYTQHIAGMLRFLLFSLQQFNLISCVRSR